MSFFFRPPLLGAKTPVVVVCILAREQPVHDVKRPHEGVKHHFATAVPCHSKVDLQVLPIRHGFTLITPPSPHRSDDMSVHNAFAAR